MQEVHKRFPMLGKLGESYGKGARKESQRRQKVADPRPRLLEWTGQGNAPPSRSAASRYQRLSDAEHERFVAREEIPLLGEDDG